MFVYYFMFFIPIYFMFTVNVDKKYFKIIWYMVMITYIILVGLRLKGGDLHNYFVRFESVSYIPFYEFIHRGEINFQLLNYFVYHLGMGFEWVTLICAFISMIGLMKFLEYQYNPWLGLIISVPYIIIVVYMGYMRQGVALGLIMWGLVELLYKNKFWKFMFFILLATTFHSSAIILVPFAIFSSENKGKFLKFLGVIMGLVGIWIIFLKSDANSLWQNYIEKNLESQGALIRVILNLIPATLFFYFRKEWYKNFKKDYNFWKMIAIASLLSLFFVKFASTAVDRIALYFIPLQIVVYTRLSLFLREKISPLFIIFLIIIFYLIILFVWLNFSTHAYMWIPYRNFLIESIF